MGKKQAFWATMGLIMSTNMGCTTILDIDQEYGTCAPPTSYCGGACVDKSEDPQNCGSCGHDCQGGTCLEGTCQPVVLADMQVGANYIAVDATNVYWTNRYGRQVMKMAIDGGAPIELATGQQEPRCIAVDATSVYWTNEGTSPNSYMDGTVMRVGIDGTGLTPLATGQNRPYDIVVNDEAIFWTNEGTLGSNDNTIMTIKHGESVPQVIAPLPGDPLLNYPQAIAVDATNVYWTDADHLTKAAFDGKSRTDLAPLVTNTFGYSRITMHGTSIYWTNTDGDAVNKVGITGSSFPQLAASPAPFGIAVDATSVYWTSTRDETETMNGTVRKVGIGGGTATILAEMQQYPLGIAVDDTCIYWANGGDNTVMKLAK